MPVHYHKNNAGPTHCPCSSGGFPRLGFGPKFFDYDFFLPTVAAPVNTEGGILDSCGMEAQIFESSQGAVWLSRQEKVSSRGSLLPPHLAQPCFPGSSDSLAQKWTWFAWLEWKLVAQRPTFECDICPFPHLRWVSQRKRCWWGLESCTLDGVISFATNNRAAFGLQAFAQGKWWGFVLVRRVAAHMWLMTKGIAVLDCEF